VIAFSWRQFRTQALIGAAGLVVLGVILLVTGPNLVHVYDVAVAQCRASGGGGGGGGGGCINPVSTDDGKLQTLALALVLIVPVVIGMFWGAPLVARELETGTFRLAWTQSVSRLRWLLVKLGLVGLASAVVGGLLSLMVSWWFSPIDKVSANRFSPAAFGMHGFVPAGYALFAFALGATTGLLFRRTLPAMAVTLVGFIAARVVVAEWIRPHFMSPVSETMRVGQNDGWGITMSPAGLPSISVNPPNLPNALIVSNNLVNNAGQSPTGAYLQKVCPNLPGINGPTSSGGPGVQRVAVPSGGQQAFQQCVDAVSGKFHEVVLYQPANRFWVFQTYETLLFVILSAALAGFCVWWVRRRLN
jgi:ABC-type transport system involved in multi-copper enzyme maturation permease subunit